MSAALRASAATFFTDLLSAIAASIEGSILVFTFIDSIWSIDPDAHLTIWALIKF